MSATVFPSVQPVDDATIVEDHLGLYSITYTPTRAGVFDIFVQINGNDVATDLTAGIKVAPAVEYAATSTHNVSQVNIEGVREYFAIQLRDRFGNELSGPLDPLSSLVIQLNGRSDGCEISQTVVIPVVSSTALPVTNGVYNFWYNPTIAGNYLLSAGLITRGGLKGTYFRRKDLTDPLLPSHSHLYDDYFHNPGWCDGLKSDAFSPFWTFGTVVFCDGGLSGCGCDSTKLDRMLYFDWGNDSPLVNETYFGSSFPNDFFSASWQGYIVSPQSGAYTFTVASDYGARVVINGTILLAAMPMSTASATFVVQLNAGEMNDIVIEYFHNIGRSIFSVLWSGPGVMQGSVLGGDHLAYRREIINSPLEVVIFPGAVDAETSSATGSGLTTCTTLESCSFVIHARDTAGNNIHNFGEQNWNVSIYGVADWAGFGMSQRQINDYNYTGVEHLPFSIEPLGWSFVGTATIFTKSRTLQFGSTVNSVSRGDTVVVNGVDMLVDDYGAFDTSNASHSIITLNRPYLGDTVLNQSVYKLLNCTTGLYRVTYKPNLRGHYEVDLRTNSINEVQYVDLFSLGNLGGSYTIAVSAMVDGDIVTRSTDSLSAVISCSKAAIELALNSLTNIDVVSVNIDHADSSRCQYSIIFLNMNQDMPAVEIDSHLLVGNGVQTHVSELVKGGASLQISNAPFTLSVMPNVTNAAYSTAFGSGLVTGITGETSKFRIQAKDSFGNNKLHSQGLDYFHVHAFIADRDLDDEFSFVDGSVSYISSDSSLNWMDNRNMTCSDYVKLPYAPNGVCLSEACGCGASENINNIGDSSSGMPADQACCGCQSSCGGLYEATFTPYLSGQYSVVVLQATSLEVQNISTHWTSAGMRSGSFQIWSGDKTMFPLSAHRMGCRS
jgi:hypothetical protein